MVQNSGAENTPGRDGCMVPAHRFFGKPFDFSRQVINSPVSFFL
jgi:hypothetical protein